MQIKVERKEVTNLKITIAKDEIRIKIPPAVSQDQVDRISKFCEYVYSQVPTESLEHTLRGNINVLHRVEGNKLCVKLNHNNKKYGTKEFVEGII